MAEAAEAAAEAAAAPPAEAEAAEAEAPAEPASQAAEAAPAAEEAPVAEQAPEEGADGAAEAPEAVPAEGAAEGAAEGEGPAGGPKADPAAAAAPEAPAGASDAASGEGDPEGAEKEGGEDVGAGAAAEGAGEGAASEAPTATAEAPAADAPADATGAAEGAAEGQAAAVAASDQAPATQEGGAEGQVQGEAQGEGGTEGEAEGAEGAADEPSPAPAAAEGAEVTDEAAADATEVANAAPEAKPPAGTAETLFGAPDEAYLAEIEGYNEDEEEAEAAAAAREAEAAEQIEQADELASAQSALANACEREAAVRSRNAKLQRAVAAVLMRRQSLVAGGGMGGGMGGIDGGDVGRGGGGVAVQSAGDADAATRYASGLTMWHDAREELEAAAREAARHESELRTKLVRSEEAASSTAAAFVRFRAEVARAAENSRTGNRIAERALRSFERQDEAKEDEVQRVRLRNIQLRATLRKLEGRLRQKEELVDGLHLIDFEQLKIENQSLAEKIEERNEELLKLRRKTTSTVQVLTHQKEKLQFVEKESEVLARGLERLEEGLAGRRDALQRAKRRRDALRADNASLRARNGKVSAPALLDDMDAQSAKRDELLSALKVKRAGYTRSAEALHAARGAYENRANAAALAEASIDGYGGGMLPSLTG